VIVRILVFCVALASSAAVSEIAACQEKEAPASVQIYDVPGSILFIQSDNSTRKHAQDFLDDFMERPFSLTAFPSGYPEAINANKPIVHYGFGGGAGEAVQLPFDERDAVMSLAAEDVEPDMPFKLKGNFPTDFPILSSKKKCRGLIKDNFLFAIPDGKKVADDEGRKFDVFKNAKLLNDSLDPRMNAFINRTGIGRPNDRFEFFSAFSNPFNREQLKLNSRELELEQKFKVAFEDANFGALGLLYADRQLNAEMHVNFSKDNSFDGVLDFDAVEEKKFQPTVGLPSEGLLASVSLQTSVFDSPDVTRFLLKSSFPGFGVWAGIERDAAMFQLTGNLIADAWEDVEGVRIGLYSNKKGTLSVISVLDAKQPDEFFLELEKLIAIVEPENENEQSDFATEEYERLISDLGARKYSVRERAETRLAIAARRAVPALKKAIEETESAEVRMRATRLINRVGRKKTSPARKASNLNFWANLDPEFAIEKGQREMYGVPARLVRIRLPKTLSDGQQRNARLRLSQLFGDQWDQVPVVRVGNQFVAMFGYDESMLESTVENLKQQKDPLGQLAVGKAPYFKEGNLQVHASFQRLRKMFVDEEKEGFLTGFAHKYDLKDVLTSLSLSLSRDYWQCSFNMPIEDFRPAIVFGEWLFGN
jgi:hypothetical protein